MYSECPIPKPERKMVFKRPKATDRTNLTIRLQPSVASRVYEIVEQTGLTPSKIIEQMLDFIGDNYSIE